MSCRDKLSTYSGNNLNTICSWTLDKETVLPKTCLLLWVSTCLLNSCPFVKLCLWHQEEHQCYAKKKFIWEWIPIAKIPTTFTGYGWLSYLWDILIRSNICNLKAAFKLRKPEEKTGRPVSDGVKDTRWAVLSVKQYCLPSPFKNYYSNECIILTVSAFIKLNCSAQH